MNTGRNMEPDKSASATPGQIPARQHPYDLALKMGFEDLLSRAPPNAKLRALGASRQLNKIWIPALNRSLVVDLGARDVFVDDAGPARRAWAVLAVHYLCVHDVSLDLREVTFAHFPDSRGYLSVFEKRIVGRFLGTAGRTQERFVDMAEQLQAKRVSGSGVRYRFDILPRVPIVMVRYEGDAELGPGASVIYRAVMERLLPAEDRIVATELLLDSLSGKRMDESPGGAR